MNVEIADWEQECCGTRISLNQVVTLEVFARPESVPAEQAWGTGLTDLFESHHDMFTGGTRRVTGRVARIRAVWAPYGGPVIAGKLADVEQIWGAEDLGDGVNYGREVFPNAFVVTLSVAEGVELPSGPAEPNP